ncbi:hypothetical protein [Pelomonas sp. KK5]|uniref:hypothetical protein n=1 Tax=Pelomonas sp. KK5 TaxID=1855730 RepID=UPI001E3AAC37|nr:hypothetical protein [Pelomonas sp. KK5]
MKPLFAGRSHELHCCPHCGQDLRQATTIDCDGSAVARLSAIVDTESVLVGPDMRVATRDYFAALYAVCHLFLRNRANRALRRSRHAWTGTAEKFDHCPVNMVELLNVRSRHELLTAAVAVLADWPASFLRFAEDTGIRHEHFSGSENLHPPWMEAQISAHLRRQQRWVRPRHVDEAIRELRDAGEPITRTAVRRSLGVVTAKAIDQQMIWRNVAVESELRELLARLDDFVSHRGRRRTTQIVRLRDAVALLVILLTDMAPTQIARLGTTALLDAIGQAYVGQLAKLVQASAAAKTAELLSLQGATWPERTGSTVFHPVRGSWDTARRVRTLTRQLMEGCDPLLRRNLKVFRAAIVAEPQ